MAEIDVEAVSRRDLTFAVTVREPNSSTKHEVTVAAQDLEGLGGGDAAELVRRSFEFLLEREPKESILSRFELSVIGRYFPEWETEMRAR